MRPIAQVALVFSLLAAPSLAGADTGRVSFSGCPTPGVERACVLIKSGATTFNVSAAKPPIAFKGLGVAGTGVPGAMSYCMQGTALSDIQYHYTTERCPAPKPAGSQ